MDINKLILEYIRRGKRPQYWRRRRKLGDWCYLISRRTIKLQNQDSVVFLRDKWNISEGLELHKYSQMIFNKGVMAIKWSKESLQQIVRCGYVKWLQFCPTLCDPMDCSPPGSLVHGILQARTLEWVAIPSCRGSYWPGDRTCISYVSCTVRQVLYHWSHLGSLLEEDINMQKNGSKHRPYTFHKD